MSSAVRPDRTGIPERAIQELTSGLRWWELWSALGWFDLRKKYRRSVIGPIWTTISLAVFIGVLGTLYSRIFNIDPTIYVPHLTLGMIGWNFINRNVADACRVFREGERYILENRIPYGVFILRTVWRNMLMFGYEAIVFVAVAVFLAVQPGVSAAVAVAGLAIMILSAGWAVLLIGVLAARYSDLSEIIAIVMRIAFFATPVLWMPQAVGFRSSLVQWNPFYHYIETVRAPLMGDLPMQSTIIIVCAITAGGWVAALLVFARYRKRIPYWL